MSTVMPFLRRNALALFVLAYASSAAVLHPGVFMDIFPMYVRKLVVLSPLIGFLALLSVMIARYRSEGALSALLAQAALKVFWPALFMCLGFSAFTTFKLAIPGVVPFYLDPVLADLDAMLHGAQPGLVLHKLLPEVLEWPLTLVYGPLWAVVWVGGFFAVAVYGDRQLRRRYWWTCALSLFGLGTVLATALSSVGPIYYEAVYGDPRYSDLTAAIFASGPGGQVKGVSTYLWTTYTTGSNSFGTGISAMPSMHVAVATVQTLAAFSVSRILGAVLGCFALCIQFGSVYLGWHYALDGYVSALFVACVWCAVSALQTRRKAAGAMAEPDGLAA
ncbi:hypothetical protein GYB14_14630 [bacterium]|nr:hypothetical protein [bacterium]